MSQEISVRIMVSDKSDNGYKVCTQCGKKKKKKSGFYPNSTYNGAGQDKYCTWCKDCMRAHDKKRRVEKKCQRFLVEYLETYYPKEHYEIMPIDIVKR